MISTYWFALAVFSIILSGLFSGMETGLYTINRIKLELLCSKVNKNAKRVAWYLKKPVIMLTLILLANNSANYIGSRALSGFLESKGLSDIGIVLIDLLILIPGLLLFGELIPKELFRLNTDKWTYKIIRILDFVGIVMTVLLLAPIICLSGKILEKIIGKDKGINLAGRKRVLGLLEEGVDAGVLSTDQKKLAEKSLAMREEQIFSHMISWNKVTTISLEMSKKSRENIIKNSLFTRIPVLNKKRRVCGVVNTVEVLMNPEMDTKELMNDPIFVKKRDSISKTLRAMRTKGAIAIIESEKDKKPLGIVTIKNLIEPLTGEFKSY